jgi:TM2 domain-containing membrane protein YozV
MTETTSTAGAPKSRTAYILLAWFLGIFGIHNFYSGHKKHGFIKLGLLVACGLGLIVNPIWSIVEMITVTKDADGVNFN